MNSNRRFLHWLQDEFQSERLLPGLTSGVLMGITEVIVTLSLGSLIFSGELAVYLPYGIGMALGFFKLGRLLRFTPYPVVGGFLAGTRWLLVQGSFDVMAGYSLTLTNLTALFQPKHLILWVPGLLFALVLFFGLQRIHHFLAMPGILLGSIALFYLALLVTGTSIDGAIESDLPLGRVAGDLAWQPLALKSLLSSALSRVSS